MTEPMDPTCAEELMRRGRVGRPPADASGNPWPPASRHVRVWGFQKKGDQR